MTMDEILHKIRDAFKDLRQPVEVKSFEEKQLQEEAFDPKQRGQRSVTLSQIVGSVGRYHDFDSRFRLKQHLPSERLVRIKNAMQDGKVLPPVKLYQIKDEFYVLDGNHRVSAAKELGHDAIIAEIIEFIPSKNTLEDILYREKSGFLEKCGFKEPIELTEVGKYAFLERQILRHHQYLAQKQEARSFEFAARDWYRTIFRPLVCLIQRGGLLDSFPGRTLADLYVYISHHQWDQPRERKYGHGIDQFIPGDMEEFRTQMAARKEFEYPEMQREITVFILMNVSAKKEFRIVEKLFALEEVREVHSVHGSVDLIVKVVLRRNLITSDAETISYFVHNNVRQISGIINTQTLIPGFSKIKS